MLTGETFKVLSQLTINSNYPHQGVKDLQVKELWGRGDSDSVLQSVLFQKMVKVWEVASDLRGLSHLNRIHKEELSQVPAILENSVNSQYYKHCKLFLTIPQVLIIIMYQNDEQLGAVRAS